MAKNPRNSRRGPSNDGRSGGKPKRGGRPGGPPRSDDSGGPGRRGGSSGSRSTGPSQGRGAESGGPESGGSGGGGGGRQRRGGSKGPTRSRAVKKGLGGDQVEGRQAVRELLLAGKRRVREILIIEDLDSADILDDISELAFEMKIPLRAINRKTFDREAFTESHQGVLARAQELPEQDLDDLIKAKGTFLLVLDGITDPGNLGAILRTAECAGVTGIVLPRHRAVHISPTVTKTAAGAIEQLPMALVGGIPAALTRMQELGVFTVGLDSAGDANVHELPLTDGRPLALVLGAEGKGLSRLVSERVDTLANIPMSGQLNSLNVAMAGAVACFEVARQRAINRKG